MTSVKRREQHVDTTGIA